MRILIIEDEFNLADAISERLKKNKYLVDIETDGEDGLYSAETGIYDLILLDVMLPRMDGFTILKKLREEEISSKIIMLTARGEINDKLEGFKRGADDYLPKPFHMDELLARITVQLKKNNDFKNKNIINYSDLSLDTSQLTITCINNNESTSLVFKEYQLLEYFMNNPNQILSKDQIYDKIWGMENEIESNNLEAYLSFIRKKLKAIDSHVTIKAVRNMGYKLEEK